MFQIEIWTQLIWCESADPSVSFRLQFANTIFVSFRETVFKKNPVEPRSSYTGFVE